MFEKGVIGFIDVVLEKNIKTKNSKFEEVVETVATFETVAKEKSLTRSDYFQNDQMGYRQMRVLEISRYDFDNHEYILIDGKRYKVRRTYYLGEYIEVHVEAEELNF